MGLRICYNAYENVYEDYVEEDELIDIDDNVTHHSTANDDEDQSETKHTNKKDCYFGYHNTLEDYGMSSRDF